MPIDALPQPWSTPENTPVRVRYQRTYRDLLDRPMSGKVRLTGQDTICEGKTVIHPAQVDIILEQGALDVQLPEGHYVLMAQLMTADGVNATDRDEIDLVAGS